jgi:hypothetical protein
MLRPFVCLAFALVTAASFTSLNAHAGPSPRSLAAFCKVHPNLDYGPKRMRRALPKTLADFGVIYWRCMDGKVYVCAAGASGSGCQKMNPSRKPSDAVRETCEGNPGQSFVAIAVIGNSSSTWRCDGPTPEIIKTVPLDKRGFIKETWAQLFDERGKLNRNLELNVDPR